MHCQNGDPSTDFMILTRHTLQLAKCIDKYISLRIQEQEDSQNAEPVDPRLKDVVEKMFDRCYQDSEYKQVRI